MNEEKKNYLSQFLAALFCLCIILGSEILALMYGWGLRPKSWAWIIGVGILVNLGLRFIASKL